ncbi:thiolase family protein [Lapidilactobacillus bayanensis]|uniref:thiolase family protein n=1 Tax=Lapidilactobacillus bayanensis TaxID=2485998 RepID=UPI000F7B7294|nr:thiolase family protein [Lapidilactobacillus bayanensis]
MKKVVIVAAKRTAIGKYLGQFKALSAVDLGVACLKGLLAEVDGAAEQIQQVLLGNVYSAGLGQNPARQVAILSGLQNSVTATTINDVCGSSLKALHFGQQALQLGEAQAVIVGGIESMSNAPLLLQRPAKKQPVNRDSDLLDSLFNDGLTDALTGVSMGIQVEQLAQQEKMTRQQQDEFAVKSQQKAAQATMNNLFTDEIVPVVVDNQAITQDEAVRPATTLTGLAALKPAFAADGTITAGNASPLNDGASMILLATAEFAQQQNWPVLAYVEEFTEVGNASELFGVTPIAAVEQLLARANLTMDQIDVVELNEAFAAQALLVQQSLNIPDAKLNPFGGAIALGHPLAATGTRIVTTLLNIMRQRQLTNGLATLCIGGGQGIALRISREGII